MWNSKTKLIFSVIIVTVVVGLWWKFSYQARSVESDWLTYRDDEYGFEVKYPPSWQIVESKNQAGFTVPDSVGFIPPDLENKYCDIEQEAQLLVRNYATHNPYPGYQKEAETYAKLVHCSIQVHVEKNSKQTLKDFLTENYLPYATNRRVSGTTMADKISNLSVKENGNTELTKNDFALLKFYGGLEANTPMSDVVYGKEQFILNQGQYVLFITNYVDRKEKTNQTVESLFKKIVDSVNINNIK